MHASLALAAWMAVSGVPPCEDRVGKRLLTEAEAVVALSVKDGDISLAIGGTDGEVREGDVPSKLPPSLEATWKAGSSTAAVFERDRRPPPAEAAEIATRVRSRDQALGLYFSRGPEGGPFIGASSRGLQFCVSEAGLCSPIVPEETEGLSRRWIPVDLDESGDSRELAVVGRSGQSLRVVFVNTATGVLRREGESQSYDSFGRPWGSFVRLRDGGILAVGGAARRGSSGVRFSFQWIHGRRSGEAGEVTLTPAPAP